MVDSSFRRPGEPLPDEHASDLAAVRLCVEALEAVAAHATVSTDLTPFFSRLTATIAGLVSARIVGFMLWNGVDAVVGQRGAFGPDPELVPLLRAPCRVGGQGIVDRLVHEDV